ncbi:TRAP transporter large permease [Anaerobacillus sp. MEB173]|uniref:TRAP transporter large permease n=1 Tax=Anaerobacillus sp. MEB173 TaxID=3383345 RepID=UPI003F91F73B
MTIEVMFMIVFLVFFMLLISGLYIHSVLLGVGVIGIALLEGPTFVSGFLTADPFVKAASYSLTTIPLFILMAQFIVQSGIVQDMYSFIFKISRGKTGVLGGLTVIIGGVLGAVSGSPSASSAALGQVAVPQLTKRGFKEDVAGATVAAAGSLSGIIPPSVILILYGVVTETPIGALFMGAVFPGIIMMFVIILCMVIANYRTMKKADNHTSQEIAATYDREILNIPRIIIAISLTFAIVTIIFGGIYSGFFTPTEAGAVGAFVSLIVAAILKKINVSFFEKSLSETVKITTMVLLIMIGAQIFGRFVSLSLLPRKITELINPIMEYPIIVLILISILYFVLFMFIEGAAVIVMTTPVILPIIATMGIDLLWFGVFVSVICTIGLLTPPVGLSAYAVAGVTSISIERIFKYTMMYALVLAVITLGLLIAFPEIATWLPSVMK